MYFHHPHFSLSAPTADSIVNSEIVLSKIASHLLPNIAGGISQFVGE